jgi:hypothetical protein
MGLLSKILRWLGGSSAPQDDPPPEEESLEGVDSAEDETASEVVIYDENLYERARTQWQFGDWESLAQIEYESLIHHPQRARLALLVASAHQQRGDTDATREFTRLAQEWGASKKLVSQVLIAGVYNTLGKASALCGQQQRALGHFEQSLRTGGDGGDVRLLAEARGGRQMRGQDNLSLPSLKGYEAQVFDKLNSNDSCFNAPQDKPTLKELYSQHTGKVSDKWSSYLNEYERIFSEYRNKPVNLLEVGVQNGGSLEIWARYFTKACKIVGCDVNPKCSELQYNDERISVVIGDINSDRIEDAILKQMTTIDIIIDDGSHLSSDIIKTFARYFKHLAVGGIYVAEDLHCSYWQKWEGGLFSPYSSMAFFKRVADIVNYEHWGVECSREDVLRNFQNEYGCYLSEETLQFIHSIQFCNSLCIIRKEKPSVNKLRERFVAGRRADVHGEVLTLHGSDSPKANEKDNQWSVPELL